MHFLRFLMLASALIGDSFGGQAAAAPSTFTVEIRGEGEPLIFIPGLATPGDVWHETTAQFADQYACHVVSLAGFGGRPAALPEAPFLATVRDELATYVRTQGSSRVTLVGHSLGGFLALDFAVHHPDLVNRLVVVDALPFLFGIMNPSASVEDARRSAPLVAAQFTQMSPSQYAQMVRGGENGSAMARAPEAVERIIGWALASDASTVAKALGEIYAADLRADLVRVRVPVLILGAWAGYAPQADRASVEALFRSQYRQLRGARIEISDTARHFIMLDEPAWLVEHLARFLAEPVPPAPET